MDKPLKIQESWYRDADKRQRVYIGSELGSALEFPEEIKDFSYRAWPSSLPLLVEGQLLFLCHFDAAIFSILTILGNVGISYQSLYSVLDCLRGVAGLTDESIVKSAGASKVDLNRFTATANNYGVLGVEARHGNLDWALPKRPLLPLDESRNLVLSAAKHFLIERVKSNFLNAWAAAEGPSSR